MFVTPHSDEEIFPSELHINQHPGGEDFGLQTWVNRDENVENADIVAWPCFGVTHISRPEDWPIMPVEILRVHLKPSGFFDVSEQLPHRSTSTYANSPQRNPGLDVPSSADKKSRHATEAFTNGTSNGHVNGHAAVANGNGTTNGASSCCSSRN